MHFPTKILELSLAVGHTFSVLYFLTRHLPKSFLHIRTHPWTADSKSNLSWIKIENEIENEDLKKINVDRNNVFFAQFLNFFFSKCDCYHFIFMGHKPESGRMGDS